MTIDDLTRIGASIVVGLIVLPIVMRSGRSISWMFPVGVLLAAGAIAITHLYMRG